jgi:TonB-dependent receptor
MIFCLLRNRFFQSSLLCLVALGLPGAVNAQKPSTKGRIIGLVKDQKNDVLSAATVTILNSSVRTTSNINGNFELDVDSGTYRIVVSYTGKQADTSTVSVGKGQIFKYEIVLETTELAGVTVTGRARARSTASIAGIYNTIRNNSSVSDGISVAQITRTPANNVADAIKLVNSVTIVENKFVVVRGMGERYNNIMLNGSQLPSTEANRRNFSLDLIPTSLINSILVNKTATPDMPADFAGGLVQVTTKEVPDRNTVTISIGTGYNSLSTGKEFLSTKIDRKEYGARVADEKRWFQRKWNPLRYAYSQPQEKNQLNAIIPNTWGLYSYTGMPTQDYQLSVGLRKRLRANKSLGAFMAATYRNEQTNEEYTRQTFVKDSSSGNEYAFATNINALASFAFTAGTNKIVSNNIFTRRLGHNTIVYRGYDNDNLPVSNYGTVYDVNTLLQNRLEGEHQLAFRKTRVKWFVDRAQLEREQPDSRFIAHIKENASGNFNSPDPFLILINESVRAGRAGITSSLLEEERIGAGADVTVPLTVRNNAVKLKFGYNLNMRDVDYTFVFLKPYFNPNSYPKEYEQAYGKPENEVIVADYFKKGFVQLLPFSGRGSRPVDQYTGTSDLHAGYIMTDWEFTRRLRAIAGVRAENFVWDVRYVLQQDSIGKVISDSVTTKSDFKLYPSVNLQYEITKDSKLRMSFSKTVSRPDFREVAPFFYFNFNIPAFVYGNPFLENSYIYNYDLRYENFLSAEETISFTVFYKKFINPIETLISSEDLSSSVLITNLNQKSSDNLGIEVDFRKSLNFGKSKTSFLKDLFVTGNASFMRSTVNINQNALGILLNKINPLYPLPTRDSSDVRDRPLQGLSPYVLNLGLLYQGKIAGVNVVYNRIGRRVILSGRSASNDLYENPRDIIDAQLFVKLFKGRGEIKLNISDILAQPFIQYDNSKTTRLGGGSSDQPNDDDRNEAFTRGKDFILYEARRGTTMSLSLNYRF